MPDRFDKPFRYGDKVVYDSSKFGLVTGVVQADEKDFNTLRVLRDNDGKMHYLQSIGPRGYKYVLNLTAWAREQLDNGTLDLIH